MWRWVVLVTLVVIFMIIVLTHREPPMLSEIKQRYWKILDMLRASGDPAWHGVLKPAIITGMVNWSKNNGPIGSNVNKGYEIYLCLEGDDINSAMYVLIHELAHMSVPEYDHTSDFWKKFEELKNLCIMNGLYENAGDRQYCGETVWG